jgi:hypothetical protein
MPSRPSLAIAFAATLVVSPPARGEGPADLAGPWRLNRELSGDIAARIAEAAGSQYMSGGPTWAAETWIPWGTSFGEGERVAVREFLLATIPALQEVEIEVSPAEVKTVHGEAGVRIFNLTRKSAGTSAITGERVMRQAAWRSGQLSLESKGKEGGLTELLTLVPARNQLTYAMRLETKTLDKPLELALVYDRAPAP